MCCGDPLKINALAPRGAGPKRDKSDSRAHGGSTHTSQHDHPEMISQARGRWSLWNSCNLRRVQGATMHATAEPGKQRAAYLYTSPPTRTARRSSGSASGPWSATSAAHTLWSSNSCASAESGMAGTRRWAHTDNSTSGHIPACMHLDIARLGTQRRLICAIGTNTSPARLYEHA